MQDLVGRCRHGRGVDILGLKGRGGGGLFTMKALLIIVTSMSVLFCCVFEVYKLLGRDRHVRDI